MSSHAAVLSHIYVPQNKAADFIRVGEADDVIWIHPDLWKQVTDPNRERITGDMEVTGDVVEFGTPGEGLGRLTYRVAGTHRDEFGQQWHVIERKETAAA